MGSQPGTGRDRALLAASVAVLAAISLVAGTAGQLPASAWGEQVRDDIDVVGHSPLEHRGQNSALAVEGDYVYVGSRAGASHPQAGVLVVDVTDPSEPEVVNRIGEPHHAQHGESSRELRVWPQGELLVVLDFPCASVDHACYSREAAETDPEYELYDIGDDNAADPVHLGTYEPREEPHEFYLWIDPSDGDRALLFQAMNGHGEDEVVVADISAVPEGGEVEEIAAWSNDDVPGGVHSLSVHPDGTRGYLAHSGGGYLELDTSEVAEGLPEPEMQLVTPPDEAAAWEPTGAHSAVKVPGEDYVWTTEETYGWYFGIGKLPFAPSDITTGCPWSWARAIDTADPADPRIVAEFKIHENTQAFCDTPEGQVASNTTTYSAHNPTVTPNLVLHTWYAGGVVVADISDPAEPEQVAEFRPEPLPVVTREDPAVTTGPVKVAMWSYPVVHEGLVYVTDIRNGLYVLDYDGPHEDEVEDLAFYESNSNRGDALELYGATP